MREELILSDDEVRRIAVAVVDEQERRERERHETAICEMGLRDGFDVRPVREIQEEMLRRNREETAGKAVSVTVVIHRFGTRIDFDGKPVAVAAGREAADILDLLGAHGINWTDVDHWVADDVRPTYLGDALGVGVGVAPKWRAASFTLTPTGAASMERK